MSKSSPFHCPHCGADAHPNAAGCRECGARKVDGRWEDPEAYDGVDLPDDDFDYEEFIRNEFGEGEGRDRSFRKTFWWVVAVITLIAFAWISFRL